MGFDKVILVNENDEETGISEKMQAHELGLLHRAFSIFVFNSQGQVLLQQRAESKYHGGGLWTNTCCSHPQPNHSILADATSRLAFEMGIQTDLTPLFSFIYHTPVENNLIEHEYDHVFLGHFEGHPNINPEEVQAYKWEDPEAVLKDIKQSPERYTKWFIMAFPIVLERLTR